jgi:RNA polymerase sigma factor (TIGR02999 family)
MVDTAPDSSPAPDVDQVFSAIYDRLKMLASRQRRGAGPSSTLCTTELVHEAYVRISESNFEHRDAAQFYGYAARAMRSILTDAARRRIQPKRGGDLARLSLTDPAANAVHIDPELALQLSEAIDALGREDARSAKLLELHYFAGLSLPEAADVLGVALRTAERDWRYARAFIASHASGQAPAS